MKEKDLYIGMPEDTKYRQETVAEDKKRESTVESHFSKVNIPKPQKLVGGSEVYQKEGIPYWYCKIKDGRDEFMHLYIGDLTKEDLLYTKSGGKRFFLTGNEQDFREDVLEALSQKGDRKFYWLPVFEPSIDENGSIQFVAGNKPFGEFSIHEWEKTFKNYSPENESSMASTTTYFLLLLRWLKDGIVTLEQLAEDSSDIGNYWDLFKKNQMELTGARMFGGLYGFAGNTTKIVKNDKTNSGFSQLGGHYDSDGDIYPVSNMGLINSPANIRKDMVGLLELKK